MDSTRRKASAPLANVVDCEKFNNQENLYDKSCPDFVNAISNIMDYSQKDIKLTSTTEERPKTASSTSRVARKISHDLYHSSTDETSCISSCNYKHLFEYSSCEEFGSDLSELTRNMSQSLLVLDSSEMGKKLPDEFKETVRSIKWLVDSLDERDQPKPKIQETSNFIPENLIQNYSLVMSNIERETATRESSTKIKCDVHKPSNNVATTEKNKTKKSKESKTHRKKSHHKSEHRHHHSKEKMKLFEDEKKFYQKLYDQQHSRSNRPQSKGLEITEHMIKRCSRTSQSCSSTRSRSLEDLKQFIIGVQSANKFKEESTHQRQLTSLKSLGLGHISKTSIKSKTGSSKSIDMFGYDTSSTVISDFSENDYGKKLLRNLTTSELEISSCSSECNLLSKTSSYNLKSVLSTNGRSNNRSTNSFCLTTQEENVHPIFDNSTQIRCRFDKMSERESNLQLNAEVQHHEDVINQMVKLVEDVKPEQLLVQKLITKFSINGQQKQKYKDLSNDELSTSLSITQQSNFLESSTTFERDGKNEETIGALDAELKGFLSSTEDEETKLSLLDDKTEEEIDSLTETLQTKDLSAQKEVCNADEARHEPETSPFEKPVKPDVTEIVVSSKVKEDKCDSLERFVNKELTTEEMRKNVANAIKRANENVWTVLNRVNQNVNETLQKVNNEVKLVVEQAIKNKKNLKKLTNAGNKTSITPKLGLVVLHNNKYELKEVQTSLDEPVLKLSNNSEDNFSYHQNVLGMSIPSAGPELIKNPLQQNNQSYCIDAYGRLEKRQDNFDSYSTDCEFKGFLHQKLDDLIAQLNEDDADQPQPLDKSFKEKVIWPSNRNQFSFKEFDKIDETFEEINTSEPSQSQIKDESPSQDLIKREELDRDHSRIIPKLQTSKCDELHEEQHDSILSLKDVEIEVAPQSDEELFSYKYSEMARDEDIEQSTFIGIDTMKDELMGLTKYQDLDSLKGEEDTPNTWEDIEDDIKSDEENSNEKSTTLNKTIIVKSPVNMLSSDKVLDDFDTDKSEVFFNAEEMAEFESTLDRTSSNFKIDSEQDTSEKTSSYSKILKTDLTIQEFENDIEDTSDSKNEDSLDQNKLLEDRENVSLQQLNINFTSSCKSNLTEIPPQEFWTSKKSDKKDSMSNGKLLKLNNQFSGRLKKSGSLAGAYQKLVSLENKSRRGSSYYLTLSSLNSALLTIENNCRRKDKKISDLMKQLKITSNRNYFDSLLQSSNRSKSSGTYKIKSELSVHIRKLDKHPSIPAIIKPRPSNEIKNFIAYCNETKMKQISRRSRTKANKFEKFIKKINLEASQLQSNRKKEKSEKRGRIKSISYQNKSSTTSPDYTISPKALMPMKLPFLHPNPLEESQILTIRPTRSRSPKEMLTKVHPNRIKRSKKHRSTSKKDRDGGILCKQPSPSIKSSTNSRPASQKAKRAPIKKPVTPVINSHQPRMHPKDEKQKMLTNSQCNLKEVAPKPVKLNNEFIVEQPQFLSNLRVSSPVESKRHCKSPIRQSSKLTIDLHSEECKKYSVISVYPKDQLPDVEFHTQLVDTVNRENSEEIWQCLLNRYQYINRQLTNDVKEKIYGPNKTPPQSPKNYQHPPPQLNSTYNQSTKHSTNNTFSKKPELESLPKRSSSIKPIADLTPKKVLLALRDYNQQQHLLTSSPKYGNTFSMQPNEESISCDQQKFTCNEKMHQPKIIFPFQQIETIKPIRPMSAKVRPVKLRNEKNEIKGRKTETIMNKLHQTESQDSLFIGVNRSKSRWLNYVKKHL